MKLLSYIIFSLFLFNISIFAQTDVQDFLEAAKRFEYSKEYEKAIVEINKAIKIQPADADLYLKKATYNSRLKNEKSVLQDVLTAVSLKPNDEYVAERGAMQLYSDGQYEESLRIAESLIAGNAEGRYLGYRIRYKNRFQLKDFTGAINDILNGKHILSAIDEGFMSKILSELINDPNIETYYKQLFEYLEERKNAPSTMASSMALQRYKVTLYADYALFYEKTRTSAETDALLDKFAKDLSLETRAAIYEKMGKYDAAINDLTKVLESTENKEYYQFKRGDLYFLTNRFAEAIADYEAVKQVYINLEWEITQKIAAARQKQIEKTNQPR